MDNRHIQMLRLFLPYMPPVYRRYLSIYIKYLELKELCSSPSSTVSSPAEEEITPAEDISCLFDQLFPLCNLQEKATLSQIQQFFSQMTNLKEMMETMELLQEMAPELFTADAAGFDEASSGNGNMANLGNLMELFQSLSKGDLT